MKILLIGGNGKMGKQMQNYMKNNSIEYIAVDKQNFENCKNEKFDVIVDFSCADALAQNLNLAIEKHKPILIATTNHNNENENLINLASKKIAVAVCPNLSLGIFCVDKMIEHLKPINQFDFILTETHHKQKKDSPSGTAKQFIHTLSRQNIAPQVVSLRAGKIVGEHILTAIGENEMVEIKHTALSRDCFCFGAIEVCKKLKSMSAGLYSMGDLL